MVGAGVSICSSSSSINSSRGSNSVVIVAGVSKGGSGSSGGGFPSLLTLPGFSTSRRVGYTWGIL